MVVEKVAAVISLPGLASVLCPLLCITFGQRLDPLGFGQYVERVCTLLSTIQGHRNVIVLIVRIHVHQCLSKLVL